MSITYTLSARNGHTRLERRGCDQRQLGATPS